MSRSIWTRCAGSSEVGRWRSRRPGRRVPARGSTRKLVDSAEEQDVLEALLDGVKPPAPRGRGFDGLHYLLATPFRHPPLRYGSRFGTRAERGIWYGALEARTCFAEAAYYRLVFLAGTAAALTPLEVELSLFEVDVAAERGVDLRAEAFAPARRALASPTRYDATQALGAAMRGEGVQAFLYVSARDAQAGTNVGLFDPVPPGPRRFRAFRCTTDHHQVEVVPWASAGPPRAARRPGLSSQRLRGRRRPAYAGR